MKKVCCTLCVLFLLVSLVGCDTYEISKSYPYHQSRVWYCEEIDFEILYTYSDDGFLLSQAYPLVWNGVHYSVYVSFFANYFEMYIGNDAATATTNVSCTVLSGIWSYRDKCVVVEISEDNIFDNTYEELVFSPSCRIEQ